MSYVDFEYYKNTYGGTVLTADDAAVAFERASESIDTLTFCRIIERGFDKLTEFQKAIVRNSVCALAEWQNENADILDSPLSGYSINGVSVSLGTSANIKRVSGVVLPTSIYSNLAKTGLCFRGGLG